MVSLYYGITAGEKGVFYKNINKYYLCTFFLAIESLFWGLSPVWIRAIIRVIEGGSLWLPV